MKQRIAVLVSGGVDSAVALARVAARPEVEATAFYLKIWLEDELSFLGQCPWEEDLKMVRSVCGQLGVPLEIISLQREYREGIVEYSLAELRAGRTPSSDVLCNRLIKFGAFWDSVGRDFDCVASGHYARLRRSGDATHLLKGLDPVKDQSYFLCRMRQDQVARSLFPIGGMLKAELREEARVRGLANAERPDSQGICFLGRIPYREFVRYHLGEAPGPIIEIESGKILGRHEGLWFHTIGQRKGLGLAGGPWYVVGRDPDSRSLFVTHKKKLEHYRRSKFFIDDPNWIVKAPEQGRYDIRLRHGPRLWPGRLSYSTEGRVEVELEEGDSGVAPGQFAVIYSGEECLGGGPIGAEAGLPDEILGALAG